MKVTKKVLHRREKMKNRERNLTNNSEAINLISISIIYIGISYFPEEVKKRKIKTTKNSRSLRLARDI